MWQKLRMALGPLLLILLCPPFVMLFWYTNTALGGSLLSLWEQMSSQGLLQTIWTIWSPYFWGTPTAWTLILGFMVFELVLMRILPGKTAYGPVTPKGNTPVYKANGPLAFAVTMATFCLATFGFHWFPASILYDNLGSIFGALNLFSLVFCLFLYIKGRFYPSSTDSGTSGNFLFDFYWGTELYPTLGPWNIKKFIACRFGMMSWGIFLLSYAAKQAELGDLSNAMLISIGLQLLYIAKFFLWETGYLRSLDIMHDRAGFYICWGCLVWVPCVYTSPSMYLVQHPIHLSNFAALSITALGILCILINYLADRQRQQTRLTNGQCNVWGKKPITLLATYTNNKGESAQSLLLVSGWWGIARHFHYIPEIGAAFFWSVPALFAHFAPYFYVTFLTILLIDRAFRDDKRCAEKYGTDWQRYCAQVPYKMVPFVI